VRPLPTDPPLPSGERGRGIGVLVVVAGVVVAGLLATIGGVLLRAGDQADLSVTGTHSSSRSQRGGPDGTYDELIAALNGHGQALVRGDERGWLAVVDPARPDTRDYFKRLYDTLHELQVTSWTYQRDRIPPPLYKPVDTGIVQADLHLDVGYCLIVIACPAFQPIQTIGPVAGAHPAHLRLRVKAVHRDDRWWITEHLPTTNRAWNGSNLPWADADLLFAATARVTVGAARTLADQLPALLEAADQAAKATDQFRRYLPTPRQRYLVFLADAAGWGRWYSGGPAGADGYATPRGTVGVDVVVNMATLPDPNTAAGRARAIHLLRHEFGHVITLYGIPPTDLQGSDLWEEGVAEYLAHSPRGAAASPRLAAVRRWANRADFPTALDQIPLLPATATGEQRSAFYGLGHLAIDCLATRYGRAKMFAFYTKTSRDKTFDETASEAVFGQPWPTVQRQCMTAIRNTVRA
jgi:hypothetical protein